MVEVFRQDNNDYWMPAHRRNASTGHLQVFDEVVNYYITNDARPVHPSGVNFYMCPGNGYPGGMGAGPSRDADYHRGGSRNPFNNNQQAFSYTLNTFFGFQDLLPNAHNLRRTLKAPSGVILLAETASANGIRLGQGSWNAQSRRIKFYHPGPSTNFAMADGHVLSIPWAVTNADVMTSLPGDDYNGVNERRRARPDLFNFRDPG